MPDGSNVFMFKPAVRENTPMVMALAGASGSGKTFTALELAMGLAGDGKVAVIDTEGRRALHYADLREQHTGEVLFRFDHCELRPPFEPARFLAAMKAAEGAGYRVIVIDSFSDEHEGEGGLIDMAATGTNSNSAANWARPKAAHKLVVRWLRQTRCHVIFCLRAEERVKLEKDDKGKVGIVPVGWQPVCEKRFMYDMTASFMLMPSAPGIPEPIKLQEQHRRFFPRGGAVTRESGKQLALWAAGGATAQPQARDMAAEAREAAMRGKDALQTFWKGLSKEDRRPLAYLIGSRDEPGELMLIAMAAPPAPEELPDDLQFGDEAHGEQFMVHGFNGDVRPYATPAAAEIAVSSVLEEAAKYGLARLDAAWNDNVNMLGELDEDRQERIWMLCYRLRQPLLPPKPAEPAQERETPPAATDAPAPERATLAVPQGHYTHNPGAGAEPARTLDNPSDSSNAPAAAGEQSGAAGRTGGSIPPTGANYAEPQPSRRAVPRREPPVDLLGQAEPAPEGERKSQRIEPVMANGKPDWRTWTVALMLPKIRKATETETLAYLLGDNEDLIERAKAAGFRDEIDAAIKAQWDAVPA